MCKRLPSSTRNRLYGIVFANLGYVNHNDTITYNITHGRSWMDMQDVRHKSSIPER